MLIKIVSVGLEEKTSAKGTVYQQATVTFINRTFKDKTETKRLMSFGAQQKAFDMLSVAEPNQLFDVVVEKNSKGYNDWVDIKPGSDIANTGMVGVVTSIPGKSHAYTGGGGRDFETRDERAAKQVYIVRQSSIDYAIKTLTPGAKTALNPEDIIAVAKQYEQFVFSKESVETVVAEAAPSLNDMDDDIPF